MSVSMWFVGLDLGQMQEYSALAVLERTAAFEPGSRQQVTRYAVRHLERFALGTPYAEVYDRITTLFAKPPLRHGYLTVDQTAVGKAVIDLLQARELPLHLLPVTISSGHAVTRLDTGGWLLPKKHLVGVLQVLLQAGRLQVAASLTEAPTLVQELLNFKAKITPASEKEAFEDWREGVHDDLVLAVALAAWQGERAPMCQDYRPYVILPAWAESGR